MIKDIIKVIDFSNGCDRIFLLPVDEENIAIKTTDGYILGFVDTEKNIISVINEESANEIQDVEIRDKAEELRNLVNYTDFQYQTIKT